MESEMRMKGETPRTSLKAIFVIEQQITKPGIHKDFMKSNI